MFFFKYTYTYIFGNYGPEISTIKFRKIVRLKLKRILDINCWDIKISVKLKLNPKLIKNLIRIFNQTCAKN